MNILTTFIMMKNKAADHILWVEDGGPSKIMYIYSLSKDEYLDKFEEVLDKKHPNGYKVLKTYS